MNGEVRRVEYQVAKAWCEGKHYAQRTPSITHAFGLFIDNQLRGICSYGTPASSTLLRGVCGEEWASKVLELNRLVLHENEPNMASWFVAQTFKLLPHPAIIVSYADTSVGHVGFVYQACNFIYTGLSTPFRDPKVKGLEHQHHATYAHGLDNKALAEKFGDRLYFVDRPRKHRYVMFLGSKVERKRIRAALKYPVAPYPKGRTQTTGNTAYVSVPTQQTLIAAE